MRRFWWRGLTTLILVCTTAIPGPGPLVQAQLPAPHEDFVRLVDADDRRPRQPARLSQLPINRERSERVADSRTVRPPRTQPSWGSQAFAGFEPQDPYTGGARIAASLRSLERGLGAQSPAGYLPLPSAEIIALADGLDDDPELIYEYVYNNYQFLPTWGLFQSARDTYFSKAGNALDQSTLLQALLRAAGYQTEYALGVIEIPLSQVKNWVGVQDSDGLMEAMFTYGGMSVEIDGSVVRMDHVWTRVKVGGIWYPLDPSFKAYAATSGIDLGSALGYNQAAYLAAAEQGAQIGSDWVEDVNQANIATHLTQYATNLMDYLNDNAPFAYLDDIIGGRDIVPVAVEGLPTHLPYTVVESLGESESVPDEHIYKWRVEMPGLAFEALAPFLLGERVTIFYEGATQADRNRIASAGSIYNVYPAYDVDMKPHLAVDGQVLATGDAAPLGTPQPVVFTLITAVLDGQGDPYVFQYSTGDGNLIAGEWYAFPMSAPRVSAAALGAHQDILAENLAAGHQDQSESVLGQALHLIGLSWVNEAEASDRVDGLIAEVVPARLFRTLTVSQDLRQEWQFVGGQWRVTRVHMASYTVDVTQFGGAVSAAGDAQALGAYLIHSNLKASAVEGAILEQLQRATAVSTNRILHLANARGLRVYHLTAANVDAILPLLDYPTSFEATIQAAAEAGDEIYIPEEPLSEGSWYGTGWLAIDPATGNTGSYITGGIGWSAGQSLPPDTRLTAARRGGRGTEEELIDPELAWEFVDAALEGVEPEANDPSPEAPNNAGADPVDTVTGAFLHSTTDLAFGVLGYPIRFSRTYVSDMHLQDGPLGFGWTHSYNQSLTEGSDWSRGFGFRAAMDAVGAIAEAYAGLEILSTAGAMPQQRMVIAAEGADWLLGQMTGNSVTVRGANGQSRQYLELPDGSYRPAHGLEITLIKNGDQTYTEETKRGSRLAFDADGRATSLEDANGNQTTLTYDSQGNLIRVTDAAGRSIELSCSGGRLIEITDPIGRAFHYAYDGDGNLVTYTDACGGATTYAYDDEHRVTSITDPEDVTFTTNEYDAFARVVSQIDGRGGTMYIRYGDVRSLVTHPEGNEFVYFCDDYRRLIGYRDALGYTTSIGYDASDNVVSWTDARDSTVTFAYDARGNLTQLADRLGNATAFAYDAQDNLTSLTDAMGRTTHYARDAHGNPTTVTDALGNITALSYDARGQVTALTDANGHAATYSYDAEGNLTHITDPVGNTSTLDHDDVGRLVALTDRRGHTTAFTYDASDNLVSSSDPLGHTALYVYDGNGLVTAFTDARGHVTRYGYDGQFNLTHVTDALGNVTAYEYDSNHQLVQITDANGHSTHYERDALGRLTRIVDPLGRASALAYDPNGNLCNRTKADGSVIEYAYDAKDRPTQISYPDGSAVSAEYNAVGDLTHSGYGPWQASYRYDELNRLTSIELTDEDLSVIYAYDAVGNHLSIKARRDGTDLYQLAYSYDAADRLTQILDSVTGQSVRYAYDAVDNLTDVEHGGGARTTYAYDGNNRAVLVENLDGEGGNLSTWAYTYDEVGNSFQVTRTTPGGSLVTSYTYDDLDRLTSDIYPRYGTTYEYDAVGNRTRLVSALGTIDYDYDAADQLLSAGTTTFTYDANGNQAGRTNARGTTTFSYDYEDRLIGIAPAGDATTTFRYDAHGRRAGRSGPAGESRSIHDGFSLILEEGPTSKHGSAYVYGNGLLALKLPLGSGDGLMSVAYHGDGLGSVVNLSDASGTPRGAFGYDPFGHGSSTVGAEREPYRFLGQLGVRAEESTVELYAMGFRTYDASTGRFISRDPLPGDLMQPSSLNAYVYAFNNPLRHVDPSGLRPEDDEGPVLVSDGAPGTVSLDPSPVPEMWPATPGTSEEEALALLRRLVPRKAPTPGSVVKYDLEKQTLEVHIGGESPLDPYVKPTIGTLHGYKYKIWEESTVRWLTTPGAPIRTIKKAPNVIMQVIKGTGLFRLDRGKYHKTTDWAITGTLG